MATNIYCREQKRIVGDDVFEKVPTWCRMKKKKKEADHG
jgi:hypothetical protein